MSDLSIIYKNRHVTCRKSQSYTFAD